MSIQINLQEKILNKEYDFLYKQPLKNHIILMVASGSYGYGTNVESSDLDLRGICVEEKETIFGFNKFEQFDDVKTDTVIYGIKKFLRLCTNANPNCLELLGADEKNIVIISKLGELIIENSNLFLSKKVVQSFGNYATAQLRRLQNALARDSYPQQEKEKHILNTINGQLEHFSRIYSTFADNSIRLYIDDSEKKNFEKEIYMDVNLNHYPLRDFKNIYSEMSNVIKNYEKLNHRNRKKDDIHLNKHAMHLIRLLITGTDILNGNGIKTYRNDEREFLLEVRNGVYSFNQIYDFVDEYEKKFKLAVKNTTLPDAPDYKKIEQLLIKIYERFYKIKL